MRINKNKFPINRMYSAMNKLRAAKSSSISFLSFIYFKN